jgi:hypothetical protein
MKEREREELKTGQRLLRMLVNKRLCFEIWRIDGVERAMTWPSTLQRDAVTLTDIVYTYMLRLYS